MNIAIINTYDQTGGAAKAAHRLYRGLRLNHTDVFYYVRNKTDLADKNIIQLNQFNKSMSFMDELMQKYYITPNRTAISNTLFSITYAGVNTTVSEELKRADIINLHWVEKYLSLESIKQLIDLQKPIVWTLHDERPFTGGCHYTTECQGFKEDCSQCLQLKDDPYHLAKNVLAAKLELFKDANISIATPSKWLASQVKKSTLFKDVRIEAIPNGIDTQIYKPIDKERCKRDLAIDPSSVVLQFGAQNNQEKRKGFSYLIDAMKLCLQNSAFDKLCRDGKVIILCVGTPSREIEELPIQNKSVGYIDNDTEMVKLYNATDVFILPSLEDNLPNTMLESMACKTPVIGFNTGGIPEVVNSENGRVVERENIQQLAEAITELVLDPGLRADLGDTGHQLINSKYKIADQAKNYTDFFNDIRKKKTVEKKEKKIDLNTYFDPVVGYALRSEAKHNNHLFNIPDSSTPKVEKNTREHPELFEAISAICQVKVTTNPLKKIRTYKQMLAIYHQIKK